MNWRQDAAQHATEAAPREACGLVVIIKGRERYWPAKNMATGTDHFILDPNDYASADMAGDIVAIVHSHPSTLCDPSEADLAACEASGLPWHIVSVPGEQWHTMLPPGYSAPLIGREYAHGQRDCYTLVRDWYAQHHLMLPDFDRTDEWWLAGQDLYTDNFAGCGFQVIQPDQLAYGDALLIAVGSPVPNHAAVYIGDNQIIHHVHNRLSGRDIYGDFWRKHTTHILRHENHYFAG